MKIVFIVTGGKSQGPGVVTLTAITTRNREARFMKLTTEAMADYVSRYLTLEGDENYNELRAAYTSIRNYEAYRGIA
jgi:hypothetical protein